MLATMSRHVTGHMTDHVTGEAIRTAPFTHTTTYSQTLTARTKSEYQQCVTKPRNRKLSDHQRVAVWPGRNAIEQTVDVPSTGNAIRHKKELKSRQPGTM